MDSMKSGRYGSTLYTAVTNENRGDLGPPLLRGLRLGHRGTNRSTKRALACPSQASIRRSTNAAHAAGSARASVMARRQVVEALHLLPDELRPRVQVQAGSRP